MVDRLLIANFSTGFETDRKPFIIDNDAFPVLENAYIWRGQLKKKRGTDLLGRLRRDFTVSTAFTLSTQANGASYTKADILADANVNLRTRAPDGVIVPGTVNITVGAVTYTDPGTGTLTGSGANTGTINYATGALSLSFSPALGAPTNVVIYFSYYPSLPVMGLEDFENNQQAPNPIFTPPVVVAFDTVYSYQVNQSAHLFFDVSFYKGSGTRVVWSGLDYQQFWSTNYYNAMWVTNGKTGLHFRVITNITQAASAVVTLTSVAGLIVNDYVWFNEVAGMVEINGLTGQITNVNPGAGTITVNINSAGFSAYASAGIVQTLTSGTTNQDGIRWYDGNNGNPPSGVTRGWVNFAPPISQYSASNLNPQYLVGATAIIPFKDRLLMFGYSLQRSNEATATYFEDGIIWSWNGTPFYSSLVPAGITSSLTGGATFNASAWFQTPGFGGFLLAGIQQEIVTIANNQDVILVGFEGRQARLVYTLNDLDPFVLYSINSELGSESTFGSVTLDQGYISVGAYGFILTNQVSTQRIDLQIPDEIFTIRAEDQGVDRVNAIRDFRNEWIYFSYPADNSQWKFPTQTFLYNYRDATWAILFENFTHHGNVWLTQGYTWATLPFRTWKEWNVPWGTGQLSQYYPTIAGGNQQGFVLLLDQGTSEAQSQQITAIDGTGLIFTSPDHCLNPVDDVYIYTQGLLGPTSYNNTIHLVKVLTVDTFSIQLNPGESPNTTPYVGNGTYAILTQYFVQTKQFPVYWEQSRQVRIGAQRYLFDNAGDAETTVNIYLSQDAASASNKPPYLPDPNPFNNAVIYTSIVPLGPESNNPWSAGQSQIWHRQNTSMIGDTVQLGFTLSHEQMIETEDGIPTNCSAEFALHAISIDISPASVLAF